MITFTTDDCRPHERFDQWRTLRARNLFGVRAELPPDERRSFRGLLKMREVATAKLVEIRASSYSVERSDRDIAESADRSLCIYQQIHGGGWFDVGKKGCFVIGTGSMGIAHTDLPYRTGPTTTVGFDLRIVKLPLRDADVRSGLGDLFASPIDIRSGLGAMLASCFGSFVSQAPALSGESAEVAVDTLRSLALAIRGLVRRDEPDLTSALVAGRLAMARKLIDDHLERQDLSPHLIAAKLGISVRQLHYLFEPTGTSVARYVTERRLDRARQLLQQSREAGIADVAFSVGFDSMTTFHRVFRRRFDRTPGDIRRGAGTAQ